MIYLANRYGKQFLPDRERDHYAVLQWLMFQMGAWAQCSASIDFFRSLLTVQPDRQGSYQAVPQGADRETAPVGAALLLSRETP
jgi:glutathione S-transferase